MKRLITKETRALSRPDGIPPRQKMKKGERRYPGGEAVRFAYTQTQLPEFAGRVALTPIEIEHLEAARSILEDEGNLALVKIFVDAGYVTCRQLGLREDFFINPDKPTQG